MKSICVMSFYLFPCEFVVYGQLWKTDPACNSLLDTYIPQLSEIHDLYLLILLYVLGTTGRLALKQGVVENLPHLKFSTLPVTNSPWGKDWVGA